MAGSRRNMENYTILRNISQSKSTKRAGANKNKVETPGLKGTGSGRYKTPVSPHKKVLLNSFI